MRVFVFDADDTLWMNEWQYSEAYANFFSFIYKTLGGKVPVPNLHYLRDRYFQIEAELYPAWGIKRGRVAEAMVRTYKDVCQWIRERFGEEVYSEAAEKRIREIGDQPFNYGNVAWLPGAKDVLKTLQSRGDVLCLLSSYDRSVFPERAEFLGVHEFFSEKHILVVEGKKTKEDFIRVSGWSNEYAASPTGWYAIGNGESDIRPALDVAENWQGIYIPHGSTAKYLQHDGQADHFLPPPFTHARVITVATIREILDHV